MTLLFFRCIPFLVIQCFGVLPPSPPLFSWDTVPLFIHAQNGSGPLNDTAAKYMASFPLITIEKCQDQCAMCTSQNQICQEDKIIAALQKIKTYNTETRTLFYLNSIFNYPQYNLSTQFFGENIKYLLHDRNGKLIYLTTECNQPPNTTIFDLSQNETIAFWLKTIKYAMSAIPGVVDGIFVDKGAFDISGLSHCINITREKQTQFTNGHLYMIQEAQNIISLLNNERAILIANNADIHSVNGRMFENFRYNDNWAKNSDGNSDDLIALMNERNNRISEVHGEPTNYGASFIYNQTLTAYLIAASEYSYYACTSGWSLNSGWDEMWQNPDYHKSLGKPLNDAVYNNRTKTYSRQFESGTKVWLDFEWNYPCVLWSDNTITGNQTDCNRYIL